MTDKKSWWYVGLLKNDKVYYVADIDSVEGTVMWCSDREDAVKFLSEQAIGEFVTKAMNARTDVHLVHTETGE